MAEVTESVEDPNTENRATGAIQVIVVTPEETALETSASFVALPLFDGEIGIASNHTPLIGRLGFGELRIKDAGGTKHYYVDGGFVQVADNTVSILTSKAITVDQIDADAATKQLEEARQRKANSEELLTIRQRLQDQARAQIRAARRANSKSS